MEYGILSLIPPLVSISLAFITKQTILSLVVGLWVGVTIIEGWNPVIAIPKMVSDFFIPLLADPWNASIVVHIIACSGFVYLLNISGSSKAFGDFAVKRVKSREEAQLVAYFSAFAFVYTEPTLTLGAIMRPVTERLRVSRVKLAYICDVMGCPFATLSPITSYSIYAIGLIAPELIRMGMSENPWSVFIKSSVFNFYALFGMLALLFVIITKLDIGPMYHAEKRAAETGKLIGDNDNPLNKYDLDENVVFKDKKITFMNFLVPMITVFAVLFAMVFWSGNVQENGILGSFMAADINLAITTAFIASALAAGLMGVRSKVFNATQIPKHFCKGVELNSDIPIILVLAWAMSSLTQIMDLKGYLILIVEQTNMAPALLPALIFLVGSFVAFSTGSSWGVWAIMMPLGMSMAHAFNIPIELMIGAILGGGVFGDHCSPISDTTILASTAAGADHIEHVRTQMPYALIVGASSLLGFVIGGLIVPMAGFVTAFLSTALILIIAHKVTSNQRKNLSA